MTTRFQRLQSIVGDRRAGPWLSSLLLRTTEELRDLEAQQLAGTAPRGTPAACWIRDELDQRERMSAHAQRAERRAVRAAW